MAKIKVGVAGYGTIGQRLADGVAMQGDMELVGIADLAPTLSLQALREMGLDVPHDVMLAGFDDAAESRRSIPAITTIHTHTQVMAYSAIQLLRTRVEEPSLDFRRVYTETTLIYRASTERN